MNRIYLPISFFLDRNIIDLSMDQIKRRIKDRKRLSALNPNIEEIVCFKKFKNTSGWVINYEYLDYFQRQRDHKKPYQKPKEKSIKTSIHDRKIDYDFEITMNFKDGCNLNHVDGGSYDVCYYTHIAHEIFRLNRNDMFYMVEKDNENYYHVHIGLNGDPDEIVAIVSILLLRLVQQNDLNSTIPNGKKINFDRIHNLFGFKKYLKKNYYSTRYGETVVSLTFIYTDENEI